MDCGPTCLKMMLDYYGIEVPLEQLIEECHITITGCTGRDLLRAGRLHGLDMQTFSIDADELVRQDRPAIVNWKYNHWVVFAGRDGDGRVAICNPDLGMYRMSEETFASFFTGLDSHPGQGVAITNGEPQWLGVSDNVAAGELFEYDGQTWRATCAIARGELVREGINAMRVELTDIINQINSKE